MSKANSTMNPNIIAQHVDKLPEDFTKKDLIKFVEDNGIQMINFRYVGGDGRLKTLNFVITSRDQLDHLLSEGERVDGSSLFSYIDAASSDLYVVPRYRTAYVNQFSPVPTVDIICSYYTREGDPLPSAPENIIRKAHESLKQTTGLTLEAMGELEYYILYDKQSTYPVPPQKGYQESGPFCKWESLRCESMQAIAQAGGIIKYGHSEVGNIGEEEHGMEQHEIEFTPVPLEDAAEQIVIAKWMLRMIGLKYGVTITLAPKILVGHAGSGLHIHTKLIKDGKNMMVEGDSLSETARKLIGGYLKMARSLTAFANTVPISYLRLVPHQEAPTNICWGDRNRSVLVRVPLGWLGVNNMILDANPHEKEEPSISRTRQTVEFRCPDGSANIHLLLAGLAVAARHGLQSDDSLDLAKKLYVNVNIFAPEHKNIQERLPQLPTSCWESAECLSQDRDIYETDDVFPAGVIDATLTQLRKYGDKDLSEKFYGKGVQIKKLVDEYLHCS